MRLGGIRELLRNRDVTIFVTLGRLALLILPNLWITAVYPIGKLLCAVTELRLEPLPAFTSTDEG